MNSNLLTESRFFAEKYQFFIRDTAVDKLDALMGHIPTVGVHEGADETGPFQFLMVATVADLNSHWLRLLTSEQPPTLTDYQFVACVRFLMQSEVLAIDSLDPEPALTASLSKGEYSLYICTKNIGINPSDEEAELADDDFKNLPCESYDLIFVSSPADSFGVLRQP